MWCKLFPALFVAVALSLAACGNDGPTVVGADHRITVNNEKGFEQIISDGHYSGVFRSILTDLKLSAIGKRDEVMALISFNRKISSENAIAEMSVRGVRPANFDECLAYGVALADIRRGYDLPPPDYSIVCLGQSFIVSGNSVVLGFLGNGELWELRTYRLDGDWDRDRHFLAVR